MAATDLGITYKSTVSGLTTSYRISDSASFKPLINNTSIDITVYSDTELQLQFSGSSDAKITVTWNSSTVETLYLNASNNYHLIVKSTEFKTSGSVYIVAEPSLDDRSKLKFSTPVILSTVYLQSGEQLIDITSKLLDL